MPIAIDKDRSKRNSKSLQSGQGIVPLEILMMGWMCFLTVAFVTLVVFAVDLAAGSKALYLYEVDGEPKDPVLEYLVKEGKPRFEQNHPIFLWRQETTSYRPPPRVIEFYAPWCPHCQHFVSKYVKMAKEIHAVHPNIEFHAISCVAHHDICKDQGIRSFPTVKVLKEDSYDFNEIKLGEVDAEHILRELGLSNDSVGKTKKNESKHNNLHEIARDVPFRLRDGRDVRSDQGIQSIPSVKALKEDSYDVKKIKLGEVDVEHFSRELRFSNDSVEKTKKNESKHDNVHEIARVIPFRLHDVHDAWSDAALSFEFALKTGIHMSNGPLSPEEEKAFRDWLELLSKTLPIQMKRTHDIIHLLLKNFSIAVESQSNMDNLISQNIPLEPKRQWHTCTYGDNQMGYTCGLWQLFHIMSIGVVEYNQHNAAIPTRHASETLRNYVEHFFQCEVCRLNFLDMYDNCSFDGCHRLSAQPASTEHEWRELPLWLWETHNDVNVRLMGERMEQNSQVEPNSWESQQARWPSLVACPNCWREDRSWEEDRIFEHLHRLYWHGNPLHIRVEETPHDFDTRYEKIPLSRKIGAIVFGVLLTLALLAKSDKSKIHAGRHKKIEI